MSTVQRLVQALEDEFGGNVPLYITVPPRLMAPSIVVAPPTSGPYISPGTMGTVEERWDILVVFGFAAHVNNLDQMRMNSLRVRSAASTVGARWEGADGPMKATNDANDTTAVSRNTVVFRYDPD
jgi:hypothetical protein